MNNIRRIVAFCLILVLAFTMAACGAKTTPEEPEEPEATPSMALDNMLKAIQDLDFETAQQYYAGDMGSLEGLENSSSEASDVVTYMLKEALNFDYALDNEMIASNGKTATVDVVFATYNMGEILEQIMTELVARATVLQQGGMTSDEFQDSMNDIVIGIYQDLIKKADKDLEISITVGLTKIDGQWMVDDLKDSIDFMDALTGGLISYSS